MRTIEETRKRWDILFSDNDTPSDLRATLRSEQGNLCNDGLRSAFLLFDGLDQNEWAAKLDESRDAYRALRDHFLKYIEHPDDIDSSVDPLADDAESPWQTLRNDETLRAEILQDVDRCLQENFFFQEPATKSKLTDALFVYSKLNPDVGYRQGMHELLAPILWAVDRDSVKLQPGKSGSTNDKNEELMLQLLDPQFVEHDSFTLFLSVMQTARIYYEHSETRSANGQAEVIPIVDRCQYLHKEALMIIDHELAEHLEAVDVLPQIFLTRWMRLLFGREFPFDDVLLMWDLLFAHGLRSDLVDFTCISMLLRIRWQLLEADYSTALTLLLRYPSPQPHEPQTFVHDALYLEQNPTAERGNFIISKYSGRPPEPKGRSQSNTRRKAFLWEDFKRRSESSSPAHSPARNNIKSLESILQDVSQGIQRRTEAWGVAKAVRGAVTEARKNMQTMHYEPNLRAPSSRPGTAGSGSEAQPTALTISAATAALESKIDILEERNKILATTLRNALSDLHSQLANVKDIDPGTNDCLKQALAQAVSVQVCLQDPSVPVESTEHPPRVDGKAISQIGLQKTSSPTISERKRDLQIEGPSRTPTSAYTNTTGPTAESGTSKPVRVTTNRMNTDKQAEGVRATASRSNVRPSLTDAGFSWMLDGGRNLSGFVSSTSPPPEQTRQQDQAQARRPSTLFGSGGDEISGTNAEHGELALHSLRGSRDPLSGDGPL
ncbi:hypothetical protein PENANT_c006G11196 [Penicillium antarcticum]|uniref:Rab-GAP TBC domain-containing protein n=1 Tax=Penicillium antarcticum TaxID=416450 RepID=A0A1V6QD74_9EURO|nr:uncharacterized protein N7508_009225 [Penicillium antarcticum]KAJ5294404.1 hypothetical protein N7508_009225 [Penicillium antarcticum]OQD87170.1 hypothetical protein PENANT_c006G11196 [Penicillium antarcticum]